MSAIQPGSRVVPAVRLISNMDVYTSGTLIANRYEVVLGPHEKPGLAGGMGIVYLCADHNEQGHPVALKIFKPEYLSNRAVRDRFLREGTIWVKLGRHPHIVRAYRVEYIGDGREVYFVLEWIAEDKDKSDASLRSWLVQAKPLPLKQALLFALHIIRGMRQATMKIPNLVHCDLKPENVLVGRDGIARVTDFGLAKAFIGLNEDPNLKMLENSKHSPYHIELTYKGLAGTPLYMAPEQWANESLDIRSDIYAFGCIVYEMLVGKYAVVGSRLYELERAHRTGHLRALPTELHAEVRSLVQRCLAVDKANRYSDWEDVESALINTYRNAVGQDAPNEVVNGDETRAERLSAGWSYMAIGTSYLDISKYDLAVKYFNRVLSIGQAEQERTLEAVALGSLGTAYHNMGDAHQALGFYERSLTLMRETKDRQGEGIVLGNLGSIYDSLGNARQAIVLHEQRIAIAQEIGDLAGQGVGFSNLGAIYRQIGDISQALKFYEQSLIIVQKTGNKRLEVVTLRNLGNAYRALNNMRQSIDFHEQALALARSIGDQAEEGRALGNLGNIYADLGDELRAINFYEQDLIIAREIGDRAGEGRSFGNLGTVYRALGNTYQAIACFEQSLILAQALGDRVGEGSALGNLGNAYVDLGDIKRGIEFYKQVLTIAHEIEDPDRQVSSLVNLGAAYARLGNICEAIGFLEQALVIAHATKNSIAAAQASLNLASLLFRQARRAEALPYAEYAAQIFEQSEHVRYTQMAQQLIARILGKNY